MGFSRTSSLAAFAALLSLAKSDNPICYSYGVDYIDEGHYFIDGRLTDKFSAVSYFKGCYQDIADVLLVEPEGVDQQEYICDQLTTTPDSELKTSTCPIQKNQMKSGHWRYLVLGNNGDDGQPFAWQRDLFFEVGTPTTTTFTPTVTFNFTSTPISTQLVTRTASDTITLPPRSTIVRPSTAKNTKTITPPAATTTSTKTMTRTTYTFTKQLSISSKTVTAQCTTPGRPKNPDKPCQYSPTKLHPVALETPTTIPTVHRFIRKADRAVDIEWARARIEAAKQRRALKVGGANSPFERRAVDKSVITITASKPINSTTTIIGPASTTTETVLTSTTVSTLLPPPTMYSGLFTQTVTLPTPTKTRLAFGWSTITSVITMKATLTKTTTVTPTGKVPACKS